MVRKKRIEISDIPKEVVKMWVDRFENLFKQREYGTFKDKNKDVKVVDYRG